MFACSVHSARERLLETKMAEMEESGHIMIVKSILQNGTLTCLDSVLFYRVECSCVIIVSILPRKECYAGKMSA